MPLSRSELVVLGWHHEPLLHSKSAVRDGTMALWYYVGWKAGNAGWSAGWI